MHFRKWSNINGQMVKHGQKWSNINGQMVKHGQKWSKMVKMVKHGQKWSNMVKMVKHTTNEVFDINRSAAFLKHDGVCNRTFLDF